MHNEGFDSIRLLGAGIFGTLGACCIFYNVCSFLRNCFPHKNWISPIPLVGGIFFGFAFFLIPNSEMRRFWWLAFIVDYTWPMFLWFLVFYSWRKGGLFDKNAYDQTVHEVPAKPPEIDGNDKE